MRQQSPIDEKINELKGNGRNIQEWRAMFGMENWRALIAMLETRYVEAAKSRCKTMTDLSARQARMDLVEEIFKFVCYDFDEDKRLRAELQMLLPEEEFPDDEQRPIP